MVRVAFTRALNLTCSVSCLWAFGFCCFVFQNQLQFSKTANYQLSNDLSMTSIWDLFFCVCGNLKFLKKNLKTHMEN